MPRPFSPATFTFTLKVTNIMANSAISVQNFNGSSHSSYPKTGIILEYYDFSIVFPLLLQ